MKDAEAINLMLLKKTEPWIRYKGNYAQKIETVFSGFESMVSKNSTCSYY